MGLARNIIGTAVGGAAIFAGTGALSDDTTRTLSGLQQRLDRLGVRL